MIIDIPTKEDFEIAAKDLLNLAWDIVIEIALTLKDENDHKKEIQIQKSSAFSKKCIV